MNIASIRKQTGKYSLLCQKRSAHALTGGNECRRAADALIEKRAHTVEHPREAMAAPRLLRIRLGKFIKSIHKHQKSSGKLRRVRPAREENDRVTG